MLAEGLAALTAPVCELDLQRGARRGRGGVGERFAALVVPAPEDAGHRLIVVMTAFLPDVLSRLNDVSPRPRPPRGWCALRAGRSRADPRGARRRPRRGARRRRGHGARGLRARRRPAGALARGISLGARRRRPRRARGGGARHRRRPLARRADGADVELRASTPTAVFRALVGLLPSDAELASGDASA